MKVAITGKIGSGKSEVMKYLSTLGARVLSADEINKSLLCDESYLSTLKQYFPTAFLDGVLDKKTLARIVFFDAKQRELLNSIAHPEIYRIIKEKIEEADTIFVEIPLLNTTNAKLFDMVVYVDCMEDERKRRVTIRDGRSQKEIENIFEAQENIVAKAYNNVYLINNDTTMTDLEDKVKILYDRVIKND